MNTKDVEAGINPKESEIAALAVPFRRCVVVLSKIGLPQKQQKPSRKIGDFDMDYLEYYDYEEECPQWQIDQELYSPPNCPECFMDESVIYQVSPGRYVCGCSPLYPDLRPSDLSFTTLACSCDVLYNFLGTEGSGSDVICKCSSPDLFALLERQHILGIDTIRSYKRVREDPPWIH